MLVGEYDKPILDNLSDIKKAHEMREVLRSFYTVLIEDFITAREAGKILNINRARVGVLCREGRFERAKKIGMDDTARSCPKF